MRPRDDGQRALAAIARSLATLAAVGASVGLALRLAGMPVDRLQVFLGMNFVPPGGGRRELLAWAIGGAAVACVPALVLLARRGRAAEAIVTRAAALLSPLVLAALVPQLRPVHFWAQRPLRFLALLAIAAVALERLLAHALRAVPEGSAARIRSDLTRVSPEMRERLAWLAVVASSLAYAALAARFTLFRHWRFESGGFDLGIQDNLMWNAMHGELFRSAVVLPDFTSFLAHHADLLSVLFVPVYALRPGAEWLLVLQALAIGFAAVPLYAFARALLPRGTALLLALGFLLYAPVHGANSYDFHWLPFSIGLLFALFWAIATERTVAAVVFFLLALLVREDVAIGLASLGSFLLVTGLRPRFGLVAAAFAAVWFVGLKLVVMASVGGAQFSHHYVDLIAPGESGFGSVVRTAFLNPAYLVGTLLQEKKLVYALHVFAPLIFVPLRRPAFLLLLVPGFVVTLMTTKHDPTVEISFQYVSHWIPYVFGATVLFLHHTPDAVRRRATVGAIALAILAHGWQFGAALQHETFVAGFGRSGFGFSDEDRARYERFRKVADRIPPGASVAATENQVPHLSTRRLIFTLKEANRGADWMLVDRDRLDFGRSRTLVADAVLRQGYRRVAQEGEFVLYEKGRPPPQD